MQNFFKKMILAINKAIRSRWFIIFLICCAVLLLIWVIIPGISIFGLSALKSTGAKFFTTLLVFIVALSVWLYKKNLLSFSKIVAFFVQRNEKKTKKLNLTDIKVRNELKNLVSLLKKRKRIDKKDIPIYAAIGGSKESLEAILRHSSKATSAASDTISIDKFASEELSWNISKNKALISLFDTKNFYGLFRYLYTVNKQFPLNGVIYNIDIDKIFESKSTIISAQKDIQSEIYELRDYIDKINKKYHVKIPVYITFSGIDVVSGFEDYISVASNKTKYNPLGVTFSSGDSINFMKIREKFQKFFEALNDNIITKCDNTLSVDKILNIVTFSKQVILALDSLENSLERLFDNKIQGKVNIRGLYFINYKNSETSFDFMRMQSFPKSRKSIDQRIYFLDNLFKEVILKEVYNFGENQDYNKRLKYKDYSKSTISVVIGFMLAVTWIKSSLSYINFFNTVDSKYNKMLHSDVDPNNAAINFANMINDQSRLSLNGLYYNNALVGTLSSIYRDIIKINFLPQLEKDIEGKLQNALDNLPSDGKVPSSKQVEALHDWLATYLMLVDKTHFDEKMFSRNIKLMWSQQKISTVEFSNREELLEATIISGFPADIKLNKTLLFKAREVLRSDSTYVLAYQMLKDQALENTDDEYILLGDTNDVETNYVFNDNVVKIPSFFTKKGYYATYIKNQVDYIKKATQSMWVLSDGENNISKLTLITLKANMDILYWNDYLNAWSKALDEINIRSTTNINTLNKILNSLTIKDNSIVTVLKRIVANTDFISMQDLTSNVGLGVGNRNIVSSKYNEVIKLLSEYKKSNSNKDGDDSSASGTIPLMSQEIGKIRNSLVSISLSSQPNLDAFSLIQDKKNSGIFKDLKSLWSISNNAPQPLKKWASQIVNVSTRVLNNMATKEINTRWKKGPLDYYNNYLKDRYPLKLDAYKESSAKSFIEFFKKDGVMQKFIKENLSSLIEKSSNTKGYVWSKYYGEPFAYDDSFLEMINSFNTIEEMFFSEEGKGFKLFLIPESLSKTLSVLTIDFDNNSYSYANGPQEDFMIEWPAKNISKSPVTVSYTSKDNDTNMQNFDGEWGLFKFLEKGNISYSETKGVNMFKIYNGKNVLAKYILKTNSLDDKFGFSTFKDLKVVDQIKDLQGAKK